MCQAMRLAPLRSSVTPDDPSSGQQANALVLRALKPAARELRALDAAVAGLCRIGCWPAALAGAQALWRFHSPGWGVSDGEGAPANV